MPKQYNIRWTEADNEALKRSVKNFNAKVKRLEAKYEGMDVVIPEKVTMKEMREVIGTRRDLQRELKSLQNFTQRGSEELVKTNTDNNIVITKWQKDELVKRAKIINKARDKKKEEYLQQEQKSGGKSLGYTKGDVIGMGKVDMLQFKHTSPITKKMEKADINFKMKHFRKEAQDLYWNKRDKIMIDNYIQTLKDNFNYNDVKDVIKKIESMSLESAVENIRSDPQEFASAYPTGDKQDYERYVKHLRQMWNVPDNTPVSESPNNSKAKSKGKRKTKRK